MRYIQPPEPESPKDDLVYLVKISDSELQNYRAL